MNLTIGRVYMLRGGHIMRYRGPYEKSAATRRREEQSGIELPPGTYAFGPVSEKAFDQAVGHSVYAGDVLYEITADKLDVIRTRRADCAARGLTEDVSEMDFLLSELAV
jgi:hypothetical protein